MKAGTQASNDKHIAVFFAVRNPQTGEYYRTYSKNRRSGWVSKLEDARLWTRVSQAKANITALSHGKGPVPELVEFIVTEVKVVDQKVRVAEAKRKQQEEQARADEARKQEALRYAQSEFDKAKARLEKLKGDVRKR